MQIRTIQTHELESLLSLYSHLHTGDEPPPDPAVRDAAWQEAMSNPRCRYFGAYIDGQLVATCTLMVVPNLTHACHPYGIIENVVTHAGFRKRGLGQAVLAHALEYAWSQQCYKVMLQTGRKDEATLRFYESAGFDRYGKQAFVVKAPK